MYTNVRMHVKRSKTANAYIQQTQTNSRDLLSIYLNDGRKVEGEWEEEEVEGRVARGHDVRFLFAEGEGEREREVCGEGSRFEHEDCGRVGGTFAREGEGEL